MLVAILRECDDPAQLLVRSKAALGHVGLEQRTVSPLWTTFEAEWVPLPVRVATAGHPAPFWCGWAGELVVAYTDSVTDAPLYDSTCRGESRLRESVAAAAATPGIRVKLGALTG